MPCWKQLFYFCIALKIFCNSILRKTMSVKSVLSGHSKIDKIKVLMQNGSLMKVESIAECFPWSILQYFWPALSDNRQWKPIFGIHFEWMLKTGFTVFQLSQKLVQTKGASPS